MAEGVVPQVLAMKVGLIGAGRIGQIHGRNLATQLPGVQLAAVADLDLAAARSVAERYGVPLVTRDPNELLQTAELVAVAICSSTDTHAALIEQAIELVNSGQYGNMACLFTSSGAAARKFRYEAEVGNIGINIGVAAPMAFFPFSGWRESFFGVLHGQGRDAVEFYTQEKVVVERWPKEWSRKF